MANAYIQLPSDGSGKKVQTVNNTVGGESVHASCISLVNSAGTLLDAPGSTTSLPVSGHVASGSADSGAPVKVGAVYNSTLPTVTTGQRVDAQADANGRRLVSCVQTDSAKLTYSVCAAAVGMEGTPTVFFELIGSATKTVKVRKIGFSITAAAAVVANVKLQKHSAVYTGGTSSGATMVPHATGDAAATATALSYTVDPTGGGTLVGTLRSVRLDIGPTGTTPAQVVWDFGDGPGKGLTLTASSQSISLTLGGATVNTGVVDVWAEITED